MSLKSVNIWLLTGDVLTCIKFVKKYWANITIWFHSSSLLPSPPLPSRLSPSLSLSLSYKYFRHSSITIKFLDYPMQCENEATSSQLFSLVLPSHLVLDYLTESTADMTCTFNYFPPKLFLQFPFYPYMSTLFIHILYIYHNRVWWLCTNCH